MIYFLVILSFIAVKYNLNNQTVISKDNLHINEHFKMNMDKLINLLNLYLGTEVTWRKYIASAFKNEIEMNTEGIIDYLDRNNDIFREILVEMSKHKNSNRKIERDISISVSYSKALLSKISNKLHKPILRELNRAVEKYVEYLNTYD